MLRSPSMAKLAVTAAGGGVGEHGDIRQLFVIEPRERGGNFGELHEADGAFHHARAAGAGDGDERLAGFDGEFDSRVTFSPTTAPWNRR